MNESELLHWKDRYTEQLVARGVYKDGVLTNTDYYHPLADGRAELGPDGSLTIHSYNDTDAGGYDCSSKYRWARSDLTTLRTWKQILYIFFYIQLMLALTFLKTCKLCHPTLIAYLKVDVFTISWMIKVLDIEICALMLQLIFHWQRHNRSSDSKNTCSSDCFVIMILRVRMGAVTFKFWILSTNTRSFIQSDSLLRFYHSPRISAACALPLGGCDAPLTVLNQACPHKHNTQYSRSCLITLMAIFKE